jgi:hypothetical protein
MSNPFSESTSMPPASGTTTSAVVTESNNASMPTTFIPFVSASSNPSAESAQVTSLRMIDPQTLNLGDSSFSNPSSSVFDPQASSLDNNSEIASSSGTYDPSMSGLSCTGSQSPTNSIPTSILDDPLLGEGSGICFTQIQ